MLFVLHNRWGSPTGGGHSSGTEEEWKLAEQLYAQTKIRNIALFFKEVDLDQLKDPGPQLAKVIEFKRQIENGKKYLFKSYVETRDFGDELERHLVSWLRDHERNMANAPGSGRLAANTAPDVPAPTTSAASETIISDGGSNTLSKHNDPDFNYWITEADQLLAAETPDNSGALYCAKKAEAMPIQILNGDARKTRLVQPTSV